MKESCYFSHDSNALTDPKILSMRCDYGMEGYGVFWAVIEMLRVQEEYRLELNKLNFNALKMLCMTQIDIEEFVDKCVNEYKLFETDGKYFWSESLCGRMEKKDDLSQKRRESIQKRWSKKDEKDDSNTNNFQNDTKVKENKETEDTNEIQNGYKSNTNVIQNDTKKRKEKERKEKENKEAAAITGEDVPTTSPEAEGEDVPATSPKADIAVEEAVNVMADLYFKYTGKMANAVDFVCMREIADITTNKELISETMRLTSEKFSPKFSGDKIKSFKYFTFAIKEAVTREKVRKNFGRGGNSGNIREMNVSCKPNKFINYEQRDWDFEALDKLKGELLDRGADKGTIDLNEYSNRKES